MYHGSHCIHVRFPVINIFRAFTSKQTRHVLLAGPCAQDLPLLAPPRNMRDEVFPRLDCLAAFTEICSHCFDVVQVPVQWYHSCAKLCENTRLSFTELVVRAQSMAGRPRSVDSAHRVSDRRRHLHHRLRQELLRLQNDPLSQSRSVTGHLSLVGVLLRELFRSMSELADKTDWGPRKHYADAEPFQKLYMLQNPADDPLPSLFGESP